MIPLLLAAAQMPRPVVPQGWGVNIHFTDAAPGEVAKIARTFRWVRMDFAWGGTERTRGKYDFAAYDRLLASLDREGLRAMFILDYGNDLYGPDSPRTPEARAAFGRWVAAAMARYRGRGIVWEMWNEPNGGFWKPRADVAEYILLAREVGRTIRRVAPKETLVGPATSGFDWAFLQRCLDAGLLAYWDAVTVHPYRTSAPETAEEDWLRLRTMLDRAAPGRNVPMLSGEWGYSELYEGGNAERQAQYAVRSYLVNLRCGVPLSIWYDWKDDGTDPKEPEHHFGTVGPDLADKPASSDMAALTRDLKGFAYVTRLYPTDRRGVTDGRQWLLLFRKGGEARVVGWTTGEPSEVRLPGGTERLGPTPRVLAGGNLDALLASKPLPWSAIVDDGPEAMRLFAGRRDVGVATGDYRDPTGFAQSILHLPGGTRMLQQTRLVARRPLVLTVVPTREGGLVARLENPYGRDLRGAQLVIDGKASPARAGDTPLPPGARLLGFREPGPGLYSPDAVPRFEPIPIVGATATTDGDPKVVGTAAVAPVGTGLRFEYDLGKGWRFAELHPADGRVAGRPTALGMWVEGDGSGSVLRMRYADATGQTFQPDLGKLDGTGWRYVQAPLDGSGGHWGGANDGRVHPPLRITTLALVDPSGGGRGKGAIMVARPVLAYDPEAKK